MDFEKVFDTVNHHIRNKTCECGGVREISNNWFGY